jgi:hypothetical protein
MASDPLLVDCPECQGQALQPTKFERPKRLTEPGEVNGWPGLVAKTEFKHRISQILARYKLRQATVCSYGIHRPMEGDIVLTQCGVVLRLGWQCAAKSVSDYEKANKHSQAVEQHFARVARIKDIPLACLRELKALVPELERLVHFRNAKIQTALGPEMLRRARLSTPRAAEVTVRVKDMGRDETIRIVDHTLRIEGLAFWTRAFDVPSAVRVLREAEALERSSRCFEPTEGEDHLADELDRRCSALEHSTNKIRADVMLGRMFTGPENLRLANEAVPQFRASA